MTSVINLKDRNSEPEPEVVAALEDALELARSGQLRDVAIIGSLTGNGTYTHYSTHDMIALGGQLSFLLFTLQHRQIATKHEG